MSRTRRYDNGLNKGRDDKPMGAKCAPNSSHPRGYDTFEDDHGYYGAGGSRFMKKLSTSARRIYNKTTLNKELKEYNTWD